MIKLPLILSNELILIKTLIFIVFILKAKIVNSVNELLGLSDPKAVQAVQADQVSDNAA
ncbi:hypothetical protein [Photobacterium phosphoreum]|uniref:hypothetical protein n=1 Tax=Photobacterium phosphoreum TaxID=659 RepID=UPI001E511506|nr:hypothetical protein [Photobacterium phosphoreum]MCD9477300.1 hypothetical protein [Photobacterium phosphoreum]MCF2178128.1 hypothetical protein [Photobacterium phosphoreum]